TQLMLRWDMANHSLVFSTQNSTSKGEPVLTRSDRYMGTGRSDQTINAATASAAMVDPARTSQRKDCAPMVAISTNPCRSGSSTAGACRRERCRLGAGRALSVRLVGLRLGGIVGGLANPPWA